MTIEPSVRTIILNLLRGAVPERADEVSRLWVDRGHGVEIVPSGKGLKMSATDKRIRFDLKTIDFFWLMGFCFWRSMAVYGPALEIASHGTVTLDLALAIDEERAIYEAEFKHRVAVGQALIAAQRTDDIDWPEGTPLPTNDRDGLPDVEDKSANDLVGLALAFALLHELRHVMFRADDGDDMPGPEEEMACDTWARAFMTDKLAGYASSQNLPFAKVRQKRAMGTALAAAIVHAMTAPHERWGGSDYPPISERITAMMDGYDLPETSHFWHFAGCILIAILRLDHRRLDLTAPTKKEMVAELLDHLR